MSPGADPLVAAPVPEPTLTCPIPAIDLRAVTRRFTPGAGAGASYTAVENVTMSVAEGRFVALVGPNGCGKSTILNLVAGLLSPSAGSISIHGDPLRGLNRRAAYIFQHDALLPWKTALDNVVLGLTFQGRDRQVAADLGRHWLGRVGLARFAGHFPHQLSGGMRKRIAIAQSWIVDPDIVLMDEPFSALDAQTRQLTENELLGLWATSPKTVLLVTHDLAEAIALSDEIVLLSAGPASRVMGVYPVDLPRPRHLDDLRTQPRFNELYQTIWSDLRAEVMTSHERTTHPA